MPTLLEAAQTSYPATAHGHNLLPLEGQSLAPIFEGREVARLTPIFWEHEGNRAVRLGPWKLVSRYPDAWELYDMNADRTELDNLAGARPEKVKELAGLYEQWAKLCHVAPPDQLPEPMRIKPAPLGEGAN
jgi:arylsulfatase